MFIEVVHANGWYDPAMQTHSNPMAEGGLLDLVHLAVNDAIEMQGADVLYRPNYGRAVVAANPGDVTYCEAIDSDPFLRGLSRGARQALDIRPDGAGLHPDEWEATVSQESLLAQSHDRTVVIGVYTAMCVLAAAKAIKRRVPAAIVGVDPSLSKHDGMTRVSSSGGVIRENLAAYLSPDVFG